MDTNTSIPRTGNGSSEPRLDPGVAEVEALRKRTTDFVENMMNNTLVVLTQRRDALDNAMERIRVSGRALGHYIGEFAARNHEAIELAKEIEKLTAEAVLPFSKDPPATLTQEKDSVS